MQKKAYADSCKQRTVEVKGPPLKGIYVSASGAWLDFSCGAADLCGEPAPFYEYEVKGNQVLVGRFQLTLTPEGNLAGPRVITVTVDRVAARVNFQTVYQSVQKECAIGTLRKSDKSSPFE